MHFAWLFVILLYVYSFHVEFLGIELTSTELLDDCLEPLFEARFVGTTGTSVQEVINGTELRFVAKGGLHYLKRTQASSKERSRF